MTNIDDEIKAANIEILKQEQAGTLPLVNNNKNVRKALNLIIIGTNGTGKTTALKKIVFNEVKAGRRVLVITPDAMEWNSIPDVHYKHLHHIKFYKGARKLIFFKGCLEIISEYFKNGLLIFDDQRAYLNAATDLSLHQIIIRRRQYMVDIIAVGHGFTEIQPKFFTFASHLMLFKTRDNIDRRKNMLNDFEQIKQLQAYVNYKADTENEHFAITVKL